MNEITIIDQDTGLQFTFHDNDRGTTITETQGFEYPTVRESIDDVSGAYGAAYINSKFGRRRFSFQGELISDDVFGLRREMLTVMRQTGRMKLIKFTTYDGLMLQCEAEIVKFINPYTHGIHKYLLELVAPDGRFYSQELKSYEIKQSSIQGGGVIPMSIPYSIPVSSGSDVAQNKILVNDGNEETDPVFTITGPGENFIVTNQTTDKEFTLDSTLVDGDDVVTDVKERTVVKNENTNLYGDFAGDFIAIAPGDNQFRFLVESMLSVNTMLHISFRDAYNGV